MRYTESRDEAKRRLIELLDQLERVRIATVESDYIHAEFRSRVFKFVDDVEFLLPDGEKVIHLKSASRIGYADFGANRKRVEHIRRSFTFQQPQAGQAGPRAAR